MKTLCDLYSHFSSQVMVKSMRGVRGLFVMLIKVNVKLIAHFAVVCSVAWPLNESEASVDLVSIETPQGGYSRNLWVGMCR